MKFTIAAVLIAALVSIATNPVGAAELCHGFGPQTPRDISDSTGRNPQTFPIAPPSDQLNLCNIHTHTNAEHKGPGFSVSAGKGDHGGHRCNETDQLTTAELKDPSNGNGAYFGIKPGDTIEVHWVFSSCQVTPGPGLTSCSSASCTNPTLRVETQVFLVVNDDNALDFRDFDYDPGSANAQHQPKALPTGTGTPIVFTGSTTGPSFTQSICSPLQVTWSVRPTCAKVSYNSLNAWVENDDVFEETRTQGVRQLVTAPELLSPIN